MNTGDDHLIGITSEDRGASTQATALEHDALGRTITALDTSDAAKRMSGLLTRPTPTRPAVPRPDLCTFGRAA